MQGQIPPVHDIPSKHANFVSEMVKDGRFGKKIDETLREIISKGKLIS